jgi:hypothetical protein
MPESKSVFPKIGFRNIYEMKEIRWSEVFRKIIEGKER